MARQQRLERYARQRDPFAGIVVYDGEGYDPIKVDFCQQHTHTHLKPQVYSPQPEDSPEAFEQRLPEACQDSQWDRTAEQWKEKPAGTMGDRYKLMGWYRPHSSRG